MATEAVPLTHIAWAVPPGQWVLQSWLSRRATHVCPATSSKATAMCKHTTAANQTSRVPYVGLTGAVCECISNEYVQILTPCWGPWMSSRYCYLRGGPGGP